MTRPAHPVGGFTLIEMIVVIVVTGIIAGMVAVFIKGPVDSYFDMARRAELTDVADTAARRIAREIRLALPNTLRNPADGSDQCIEFMPTKSGGRYRAEQAAPGTPSCAGPAPCGDTLDFTKDVTPYDDKFDMLGINSTMPPEQRIVAGDVVVVYNDGTTGNAYLGTNAIKVSALAEPGGTPNTTAISFVDDVVAANAPFKRKQFPGASPASRFQVLPATEHVVSFACSAGMLFRYSRTLAATWAQPASCAAMTAGATPAILASQVSACSILYQPPGSGSGAGRYGIVSISLAASRSGETVSLYHQVHVDNTP